MGRRLPLRVEMEFYQDSMGLTKVTYEQAVHPLLLHCLGSIIFHPSMAWIMQPAKIHHLWHLSLRLPVNPHHHHNKVEVAGPEVVVLVVLVQVGDRLSKAQNTLTCSRPRDSHERQPLESEAEVVAEVVMPTLDTNTSPSRVKLQLLSSMAISKKPKSILSPR
jgi:hypothetical protein